MKFTFAFTASAWFVSLLTVAAAPLSGVGHVQILNHHVVMFPSGKVLMAPNTVVLPLGIVVETNGTFTVNRGKLRALEDGDILGSDGMLLKPNGNITPVIDHVTLNRGHVIVVKDGEAAEPDKLVKLGNGTTIAPDWKIASPNGASRRILDGEYFELNGSAFPTRDTITMQNGRVMVQKNGSMLPVAPTRSMMMNDGTKVLGDGTVISFNGDRTALNEGEILLVQGVYVRPR